MTEEVMRLVDLAIEQNIRADIPCEGQDRKKMVESILCHRSGVSETKVRRGQVTDEEYENLKSVCEELSDAPIYLRP